MRTKVAKGKRQTQRDGEEDFSSWECRRSGVSIVCYYRAVFLCIIRFFTILIRLTFAA